MNGFFFIARSKFNVPILRFCSGNLSILHSICTLNCCNLNSSESVRSNRNPLNALKIVSHFVNDEKKQLQIDRRSSTLDDPFTLLRHCRWQNYNQNVQFNKEKKQLELCTVNAIQWKSNRLRDSWEKQINFLMEIRRWIKATRFNIVFYIFLLETPAFALRISSYQMATSYMSFEYFFYRISQHIINC